MRVRKPFLSERSNNKDKELFLIESMIPYKLNTCDICETYAEGTMYGLKIYKNPDPSQYRHKYYSHEYKGHYYHRVLWFCSDSCYQFYIIRDFL